MLATVLPSPVGAVQAPIGAASDVASAAPKGAFKHLGHGVPATTAESANPGRALGREKQAIKGWPVKRSGSSVPSATLAGAARPVTTGTTGVTQVAAPPPAMVPGPASIAPAAPSVPLGSPITRIIRGSATSGFPSFNVTESSPAWTGTWTASTPTTRSGVVVATTLGGFTAQVEFWSPVGQTLGLGTYNSATAFTSGALPAFEIHTDPLAFACGGTGSFEIEDLNVSGGVLVSFAGTLRFQCGTAPEYAVVRYQSTVGYAIPQTQGIPLDFPLATPGTTSASKGIGVSNLGVSDLVLGPGVFAGDAHLVVGTDGCSNATLAPGASCGVNFTFQPDIPMAVAAGMTFPTDGAFDHITTPVTGNTKVDLTVSNTGGDGSVTNGSTITCAGAFCPTYPMPFGAAVDFTAMHGNHSIFLGWSGGTCAGSNPVCHVVMAGTTMNIVADWVLAYEVIVSTPFAGSVTSNLAGISCPSVHCNALFPVGSTVTLTYHASIGAELITWQGACTGKSLCSMNMSEDKTVALATGSKDAPVALPLGTTPSLRSTSGFAGTTDDTFRCHARPCLEPPDTWVAAGPNHIVHATNDGIRVTDRNGTVLRDYFLWDFFLEPAGQVVSSDPRVIYDAPSGRWIATEISGSCTGGNAYIAVSDGPDPTGAWDSYALTFAGKIPDYPGLGRSGDKVAIAFDLFAISGCSVGSQVGSQISVVDRGTLLTRPSTLPAKTFPFGSTYSVWRPSVTVGTGNDIWVVGQHGDLVADKDLVAGRVTGTVASGTAALVNPGSSAVGAVNLTQTQNATRFPRTGAYIDGRPTDAVAFGNAVWIVANDTCRFSLFDEHACVRVTKIGATGVQDEFALGMPLLSSFGGGIGISGNGTLFVTYSQYVTNSVVASLATYKLPGDPVGSIRPSARLYSSTSPYNGSRWGDYAAVVPDPTDLTSVWESHQFTEGGGWATRISRLMVAAGTPTGTVSISGGAIATTSPTVSLKLTPASGSGTTEALISNSPTMSGALLAKAARSPLGITANWSLTSTATGGSNTTGTRHVYVQFGRGNGTWSSPVMATITFQSIKVSRNSGTDRYATAAAVSQATFAPGVQVAYVSAGTVFAEPLVGAPLAGWMRGPLLLTPSTTLAAATASELLRLRPRYIVVVGSTGIVSDAVKNSLAKYTTSGVVVRESGADRYATAAQAAVDTFAPGVPVAYVASGLNFPDALAAAAAGGAKGGPVLLTTTTALPAITAAALNYLRPKVVYIVGGPSVVSWGVQSTIERYWPLVRLAGTDRYATAVAVSQATFSPGVDVAYIAYGLNFPDALAGAAAAGFRGGPVLLTPTATLNPKTAAELVRLKPKRIVVLGGTSVVSAAVFNLLLGYATGP